MLEKLDKKLIDKVCEDIAEASYNSFGNKVPKKMLLRLSLLLLKESKGTSLNYINELLLVAKGDFEASKLLYDSKLYAQSVYYLQQSVEKISKAFGLWTGLLEEKELYTRRHKKSFKYKLLSFFGIIEKDTIGHITPKTFVLLLKKRFTKEYIKFLYPQIKDENLKTLFKKVDKEIIKFEKLINKREKLAKISETEISGILKQTESYSTIFSKVDKRQMRFLLYKFKTGATFRLRRDLPTEIFNELDKKLKNIDSTVEYIFIGLNALTLLYPLSIITYPHFSYARYPSKELKIKDYNENLGIVSSLPNILEALNKVITGFENLLR